MKNLMLVAAAALALTACEAKQDGGMMRDTSAQPLIAPSGKPVDMPVEARAGEQRAQDCVSRGIKPGSRKFSLCMGRNAEKAAASTPAPRRKPSRKRRTARK